ncbi:peptidoglycan binding domain-containing protein [Lacticaseibacillus pabuli]|uniref:Peptidoglycan binding domain-containing protein n=1 Tax=Lacticaseibacillus pabuli TaxID=3025672 RepID=A0ABY7WVP9_9LACO|nr:L,D-transpeptidase family protein [Lacticaseibacillus sp. KACC 23028]WDF83047.1 peptidoglycan binding domain-containing protein [Lacticaseibacillus sp. KACC 23028]
MAHNRKLPIALASIVGALLVIYVGGGIFFQNHMLPGTTVIGTEVGGQTVAAAHNKLTKNYSNDQYQLVENGTVKAKASSKQLGLKQDFTTALNRVKSSQNAWSWPAHLVGSGNAHGSVASLSKSQLNAYVDNVSSKLNTNRTAPQNASLVFENGALREKKEVNGNSIDPTKLSTALTKAIADNQKQVNLQTTYAKPTVKTSSTSFMKQKDTLQKMTNLDAKVKVANHTITISKQQLADWLTYTNGKVTVSEKGLTAFVAGLNKKYATYQAVRDFKSTKRGTVKVSGGTYGWSINQTAEVKDLANAIAAGKSFTKDAITQGSGYHKNGQDIGGSYVEVDLANQHEYVYKDGKQVLNSAIVSGKPDGHSTPKGVYYVWSKEQNTYLKGKNSNGSSYSSHVNYWMPIDYTGVGLHDAPWQPTFGGTWYQQHGSHGCVNNPPAFMPKLFAAVSVGTPVIVF